MSKTTREIIIMLAEVGLLVAVCVLTSCGTTEPEDTVPAPLVRCTPYASGSCCLYRGADCNAKLCFDSMTVLPPLDVYCRGAR